jgi:hypothetical protein
MASPTPAAPRISPFEAARGALEHTKRYLFPFRFEKWLVLGFLAFLDQCGRGGYWGPHAQWNADGHSHRHLAAALRRWAGADAGAGPGPAGDLAEALRGAFGWASAHAGWLVAAAVFGLVLALALAALVTWINARGTFMYLDDVATGRADIVRPWRQHAARADSYFAWRFGLGVLALGLVAGVIALLVAVGHGYAYGRLGGVSGAAIGLALAPVFVILAFAIPLIVLMGIALRDFVAPLQVSAGVTCGEAIRIFEGLLVAQPGAFVLYLLMKIGVVVVTGLAIVVGGCLTCCIGFIPIVMHVVFQPFFFFERAWSVVLLRQMGHDVAGRLAA